LLAVGPQSIAQSLQAKTSEQGGKSTTRRFAHAIALARKKCAYHNFTGCLVWWHDSRFGCERSWVRVPGQPFGWAPGGTKIGNECKSPGSPLEVLSVAGASSCHFHSGGGVYGLVGDLMRSSCRGPIPEDVTSAGLTARAPFVAASHSASIP
jgi:hypothetical protein